MALRDRRTNISFDLWCLVASGGLDIWVSSTSFQKSNIGASDRKGCKKSTWYLVSLPKKYVFQNIKRNLNTRTWMTLKSSVVIFQALEPLKPHWPQRPLQPLWPHWPLQPFFINFLPDLDCWIIPGTKMTNTGPFLWNGSSKIQIFTDFSTFSVGGCWGQLMLFFWKLIREI